MNWLIDNVARYSSQLGWIAFSLSLIPVYLAHRALQKQSKPSTKSRRLWRKCEFVLLWCIPLLGFIATKGAEWASEKTDAKVKELEAQLNPTFEKRLMALLDEMDSKILPSLAKGSTNFHGLVPDSQKTALLRLSNEPGASNFIIMASDMNSMSVTPNAGTIVSINFNLSTNLLQKR